ncbi:hypothetical protein [Pedobacter nutrimenti]|uniref:Uncharacterized protein n=1 Tax=Pedobacter nutrimenti TaxID=1241337 RepID=A0A318UCN6_9SPHI|nr:hypothetical protein [Pedobacter nutrimenti]PYF74192.1 hypothetical protein B0O44_104363 [Pedobacter nutrimenti]
MNTYSKSFITSVPIAVDPRNNDGQTFNAYVLNALGNVDWQLINWSFGSVPSDYSVTEFDVDKLFSVGNTPGNQVFSVGRDGNVGIGTAVSKEKLSVNGNIRAREIKVETANWPDYVFTKDYVLPSLKETEKYIREKGHLLGIPSAQGVKNIGVDLGEMNAKLLKKIEELTLYLIEMKKKNDDRESKLQHQIDQREKAIKILNQITSYYEKIIYEFFIRGRVNSRDWLLIICFGIISLVYFLKFVFS